MKSHEPYFVVRISSEVVPIDDLPGRRSNGVKLSVEKGQSQDGAGRFRGTGYLA